MAFAYQSVLPYEEARIHAAALYCSDGRIGEQIDEFLHQGLRLPRYDRVAVPGGPVCLAGRLLAFWEARGVEDQLRFLARAHALERVVLIAHEPCAYYGGRLGLSPPLIAEAQRIDLARAARVVEGLGDIGVEAYQACVRDGLVRFEVVPLGPTVSAP